MDKSLSDLIGELYDAAVDQGLLTGIARRIAATFDSTSTVVKIHGGDGRVALLDNTDNMNVAPSEQEWAEHWHRNDLWVERSVAFGLSRIVMGDDLVLPTEMKRSGYYQEWLRRLDIFHVVGAAFPAGTDRVGILGIHRPQHGVRYDEADRRRVGIFLPHLQRALMLSHRLAGVPLAQAAALDALDQLDTGVIVVGRARRIVYANSLAEELLRDNPQLGVSNGRLLIRETALNARLAAAVRDNLKTAQGQTARPTSAIAVPRAGRMPLMMTITPLRPNWSRLDGQQSLALVFMRDPERTAVVSNQLRELFSLTPTEAAIAGDLIRGRSISDIALVYGIGLGTVRSHLKKILIKTGTNRQAEAVARMAHSVLPVADRR
jgi:DNA-binding CsgD family transcriptional regulator